MAITSNGSGGGNWSSTSTWTGGVVPTAGSAVTIQSADTVTIDTTGLTCGDDSSTALQVNGILQASYTASTSLTVTGQVVINSTGTWSTGTSTNPIPSTYTCNIYLNNSATLSAGKWGLDAVNGSKFFSYGTVKTTNTYVTTTAAASQAVITVNDTTGWVAGDTLVIGTTDTDTNGSHIETKVIQSISGSAVTLTTNLTYAHLTNGRVSNLTKNVTYQPYNSSYGYYLQLDWSTNSTKNARDVHHTAFNSTDYNRTTTYFSNVYINTGQLLGQGPWNAFDNNVLYKETNYSLGMLTLFFGYATSTAATTVSNCAIYSANTTAGLLYIGDGISTTLSGMCLYQGGVGIQTGYSQGPQGTVISNSYIQSCGGEALYAGTSAGLTFNNCNFDSCYQAIVVNSGPYTFNNCNFGTLTANSTIGTVFNIQSNALVTMNMNSCNFTTNYTTYINNPSYANTQSIITNGNKNVNPSTQEIYTSNGNFYRDNSFYKLGTSSLRCQPTSSTNAATITFQIIAPTGDPVSVSGYLYYNSSYTGTNYPTVTLSGLGITPSTYTMSGGASQWEQFQVSGTQSTGTDGILTLTVSFQSSGAGAEAWISGISAPAYVSVNTGQFDYWSSGQPTQLIASNFTSPYDIWNVTSSNANLSGSMGHELNNALSLPEFLGLN